MSGRWLAFGAATGENPPPATNPAGYKAAAEHYRSFFAER